MHKRYKILEQTRVMGKGGMSDWNKTVKTLEFLKYLDQKSGKGQWGVLLGFFFFF